MCGRDVDRLARGLTPVVDRVAAAQRSAEGPVAGRRLLTMTNVPDGHGVFDELGVGRKIVLAELAPPGPAAMQRWLRVLAATAVLVGDLLGHAGLDTLRVYTQPNDADREHALALLTTDA